MSNDIIIIIMHDFNDLKETHTQNKERVNSYKFTLNYNILLHFSDAH